MTKKNSLNHMLEKLVECYRDKCGENIIIAYKGTVSQEILALLGEMIKDKIMKDNKRKIAKKVFSIFVEMAQNVMHHSAVKENPADENGCQGAGIIVVDDDNNRYTLTTSNLVKNSDLPAVINHCKTIESMDRVCIKQLFQEQLAQPASEEKPGAGIGLFNIALKSGSPIKFQTGKFDNTHSFLIFSSFVEKEN